MKSLFRSRMALWLLPILIGSYLRLIQRTNRWTLEGAEQFTSLGASESAIFAFWHEHLPLMPALVMLARKLPNYSPPQIHAMVSLHNDGRLIGAVIRRLGIEQVLGSTSRGGAAGFRRVFRLLKQGAIIGITPDGPRGPRRVAANGVAQLAGVAGVPVLPCAARTSRRIVLKTWDRMSIPLPFGRGVVVCGPALKVPHQSWAEALPRITAGMNDATYRAEQLCAGK
jgi:lysophospholipid acyltransferase (LPLAT)-like uncharacterized protein